MTRSFVLTNHQGDIDKPTHFFLFLKLLLRRLARFSPLPNSAMLSAFLIVYTILHNAAAWGLSLLDLGHTPFADGFIINPGPIK